MQLPGHSRISKIEPDRYADTGLSIADIPADLNKHLFDRLLQEEELLRATMRSQGRHFSATDRLSRDELHDRHVVKP